LNVGPAAQSSDNFVATDKTPGTGLWAYHGELINQPTQHSPPPWSCAVYGEGGIVGVAGLDPDKSKLSTDGDGLMGFGGGTGVHGVSSGGTGARGISDTGSGVWGTSASGCGVYGTSTSGAGVRGDTVDGGAGVLGVSTGKGDAVHGQVAAGADPAALAGRFDGNVFINGDITEVHRITVSTITVDNDVLFTGGADCAEQFDMQGEQIPEPGSTVVIDDDGTLRESRDAYDKRVAGVISGAGDFRPALILDGRPETKGRASVALVGKVYCKVDADFAPISVGDLLTTSGRPGFAMKADDPTKAFGAVIGKALKALAVGQGILPILVALQ